MPAATGPVVAAAQTMAAEIGRLGALSGRPIAVDPLPFLDRSDSLILGPPGMVSPNGRCRLIEARDGWIAVNLPRPDDIDLVPAWLERDIPGDPWSAIADAARCAPTAALVEWGASLGLPVALLGEREADDWRPPILRPDGAVAGPVQDRLNVLDLSTLWAGPLCGAILVMAGHDVVKAQNAARPDPVETATPLLNARLNGAKRRAVVSFERRSLLDLIAGADILITSARPRAFEAIGLGCAEVFAARPPLIWVAVTGHGWSGPGSLRTGFGDDAAVAGGLVAWAGDAPRFAGDAVADPLTGLAAAAAAMAAAAAGGGVMIDAALSRTAAGVARMFARRLHDSR